MTPSSCLIAAALGATLPWAPSAAVSQDGPARPSVKATALPTNGSAAVTLDGVLDERVWLTAEPAADFRQREPSEGQPATERTEVRILYDRTTLYVGVHALDRNPDGVIARILQRDQVMSGGAFGQPQFAGDDAVAILFDTFHDHRNAVVFATNPNGAEFDALLTDEGREINVDWRGVWRVAATPTSDGWSAEFAIPFRTLRYPANTRDPIWGFNVFRVIRRKNEDVLWSSWSRENEGFHRVSRAGHLQGLVALPRSGLNLEIKPYALSGVTQSRSTSPNLASDARFDVGADVKYEVRPGLLLDLTVNTDFAQVEADDQQVNLTRFNLFFPEKRDFFLENSGVFEFGERGFFEPPPYLVFFSRRIGIAADGEIPVLGGGRLTGRVGGQTVGLLNVVTDRGSSEPRTNFGVVRVKRDIGSNNYLGAIVTDRRTGDGHNTVGGVDWSFWPTRKLNFLGFVSGTTTSGPRGEGGAVRAVLDYTGDHLGFNVGHLTISPDAQADLGFITRTDIRRSDGFLRLTPRPPVLGLRRIDVLLSTQLITRTDWTVQDWGVGPSITPQWNTGESISLSYRYGFTRLDTGFDLGPNVPIPAGDYDVWSANLSAGTSGNRALVLSANAGVQGIYDGHITTVGGTITAAPNANVSATLSYTHNRVEMPSGTFNADIARMRLTYAFSTQLTVNALLQYNRVDDVVAANVRLNFIHRPGSDLFVVLNEQRDVGGGSWRVTTRTSVVKLTYLARI